MALLDTPITDAVASVLDTVGIDATLRRTSTVSYDPETGVEVTSALIDLPVKASPPSAFQTMEIDGNNILKTDLKVILKAKGLTVVPEKLSDVLIIGTLILNIIDVWEIRPGDAAAAYKLQCRK